MSAAMQSRIVNEADAEWDDPALEFMEWAVPGYRRGEVDWAGRRLAQLMRKHDDWEDSDHDDWHKSIPIINNWRAAHAYPLNAFQATLRNKSRRVDPSAIVAQRTKRL